MLRSGRRSLAQAFEESGLKFQRYAEIDCGEIAIYSVRLHIQAGYGVWNRIMPPLRAWAMIMHGVTRTHPRDRMTTWSRSP